MPYKLEEKVRLVQCAIYSFQYDMPRKNLGEFPPRIILGWVQPQTVEELKTILAICQLPGEILPIHTISSGKNWGLGSFLPVENNSLILDLTKMDAMVELDLEQGVAIIEPGVTQMQLSKALVGTSYMLNATSSCMHSSILGNILERGVGFHRQREQDLIGAEILLSTGDILQVGAQWPFTADIKKAFFYRHGLGPNPLPLCFQSNIGIVTKCVVALLHRPERMHVLKIAFGWHQFDAVTMILKKLYAEEVLKSVMKIYNTSAIEMYGGKDDLPHLQDFQGYCSIEGPDAICSAKLQHLKAHFKALKIPLEEISANAADTLDKMIYACFHGNPSYNNAMINQSFKVQNCALDATSLEGWISFLPIVPFDPARLRKAYKCIQDCVQNTAVCSMVTINIIAKSAIDLVVALRFKREPTQIAEAHQVLQALYMTFAKEGFYPYRLDMEHMSFLEQHLNKNYLDILRNIKNVFDPKHIIMPGRYAL